MYWTLAQHRLSGLTSCTCMLRCPICHQRLYVYTLYEQRTRCTNKIHLFHEIWHIYRQLKNLQLTTYFGFLECLECLEVGHKTHKFIEIQEKAIVVAIAHSLNISFFFLFPYLHLHLLLVMRIAINKRWQYSNLFLCHIVLFCKCSYRFATVIVIVTLRPTAFQLF